MTITRLTAENFKRIVAINIEPDGSPLVIVGGKNSQGKTSTLDAIEAALGGGKRVPEKPIRDGASKSRIVVETEELTVTRTFTAKGSRLEVRPRAENAVPMGSPQKVLDALVGSLTFDPLEFDRMDPKKQSGVLRRIGGVNLEEIDKQREEYVAQRRDVGRDLGKAKGALAKLPPAPAGDAGGMTVAEILEEIAAREQRNDNRNNKRGLLATKRSRATEIIDEDIKIRETIEECQKRIEELLGTCGVLQDELDGLRVDGKALAAEVDGLPSDETTDDLKAQLDDAERIALAAAEAGRRTELTTEVEDLSTEYANFSDRLEQIDAVRNDAITKAKYPVPGLEAQDEGVYLNGVPWQQASSAEALGASVAIGLALNPKLKILLIRDGSLLDADSLELIRDLAHKADAQLWIERVGDGDEISVVIEDGTAVLPSALCQDRTLRPLGERDGGKKVPS